MSFNSVSYLLFLAVVAALHWSLPPRTRPLLILVASLCFYACWKPVFVVVMAFSALTDYAVALRMSTVTDVHARRRWLWLSVTVNLGLLGVFKYLQFVVDNGVVVLNLLGAQLRSPALDLLLPLGISFYTFETLSYVIDVYRGQRVAERSLLLYGCFVGFFPKLVAGPILRASELLPQFARAARFDAQQAAAAVIRIVVGLALKVAVADNLAPLVDEGFLRAPAQLSAPDVWTLAFLFGFQVYCDFSAYSSIAIGSAQLLGIHVPENFDWPYLARSPREFWRRWHISLSTWIRDYLYLPLQGIRPRAVGSAAGRFDVAARASLLALFVTWALMGLWHGAQWHFVLWGLYHAALIAVYRRAWPDERHAIAGWLLTLATVMLGWIPFRAASIGDALALWGQLWRPHAYTWLGLRENSYLVAALLLLGMLLCKACARLLDALRRRSATAEAVLTSGGLALLIVAVFLFLRPVSQFLYFQF